MEAAMFTECWAAHRNLNNVVYSNFRTSARNIIHICSRRTPLEEDVEKKLTQGIKTEYGYQHFGQDIFLTYGINTSLSLGCYKELSYPYSVYDTDIMLSETIDNQTIDHTLSETSP